MFLLVLKNRKKGKRKEKCKGGSEESQGRTKIEKNGGSNRGKKYETRKKETKNR